MDGLKADIMQRLRRDILCLEGYKSLLHHAPSLPLGPLLTAFPGAQFPTAAIHEFIVTTAPEEAATSGFLAFILSGLMKNGHASLWVTTRKIFPPGLTRFGLDPSSLLFVNVKKEKDLLWVIEESLKCSALAAVVGEVNGLDFQQTRRLQLAVEDSKSTGLIMQMHAAPHSASLARWKISPVPGTQLESLPGVGLPAWEINLLRLRNGKPHRWTVTYDRESLKEIIIENEEKIWHQRTG